MLGCEVTGVDGERILIPFTYVVKMERPATPPGPEVLWVKLFDPMGVSIKVTNKEEIEKVWDAYRRSLALR